jgi:hypothetical protein
VTPPEPQGAAPRAVKPSIPLRIQALYLVAAVAGFVLGLQFGLALSGPLLAIVTGLNAAVFGVLMAGAGVDAWRRLREWRESRRPQG